MKTLIKDVAVYRDGEVTEHENILIDGNRIASFPKDVTEIAADEILEGNGMLALPGLIDAHTHSAMVLFRSYADDLALMDWLQTMIWPAEAHLDDDIVYWGSMLAFAEMIRGGATAFCDMYMFVEATARAAADSGMRGNIARGLAGNPENGAKSLEENIEFYKNWNGAAEGLIRVMLGPHAPYTCTSAYLKKVRDAELTHGIPIHIHLAETKGEAETCIARHGVTPIRHMEDIGLFEVPTLAAHCVHVTDEDIEIMAKHHVRVAHNPGSNLKLASGFAPVTKMKKAGISVGLGTDGASSNNKLDMFAEMRLAALIHKANELDPFAIKAEDAIDMATKGGAACLGYDDLGELREGFLADIILVDRSGFHWQPGFHPASLAVYAGNAMDVDTVFINGKCVMRKKELTTIDAEKVKAETARVTEKLYAFSHSSI